MAQIKFSVLDSSAKRPAGTYSVFHHVKLLKNMNRESNDDILEKVKEFAHQAHGDQKRKYTPDPYIVHPYRVMKICKDYSDDITVLSAALLHDVLEDTETTKEDIFDFLREHMSEGNTVNTVELVKEMTDVYVKQSYPRLNRNRRKRLEAERMAKTSHNAQTIKYADIIDNCNEIVDHDPDFAGVFLFECKKLLDRIDSGNAELRKKAFDTVNLNLANLKNKQKALNPPNEK